MAYHLTLYDSVHHPSVAEVPWEVPSIFPVGPPLHPCADVGLPQRVLCDAQMVRAIVRLSVVKREGDAVWLWSEGQAQVNFFLWDVFFQVPSVHLVCCWVNRGHARGSVWRNSCLLIGVLSVLKLDNLTNEHSLRVCGVGTCGKRAIRLNFLTSWCWITYHRRVFCKKLSQRYQRHQAPCLGWTTSI